MSVADRPPGGGELKNATRLFWEAIRTLKNATRHSNPCFFNACYQLYMREWYIAQPLYPEKAVLP